jgi:hypothetical protein
LLFQLKDWFLSEFKDSEDDFAEALRENPDEILNELVELFGEDDVDQDGHLSPDEMEVSYNRIMVAHDEL